jgi:hypothetical protein
VSAPEEEPRMTLEEILNANPRKRTPEERLKIRLASCKPPPRPMKLVCVDGRVIAGAQVIVSPSDPNWWRGMAVRRNGEILVRCM